MLEADDLPDGEAKLDRLEEAVRLADAAGDVSLAYEARQALVDVAAFHGHPEKLLVAMAWCLTRFDESPSSFSEHDLLWRLKWVAGILWSFPQIPLSRIEAVLEDLGERFRRSGASPRTEHYYRLRFAVHRGATDEARELHRLWRAAPRDDLSDCPACEASFEVDYRAALGEFERAVSAAGPIVAGRARCAEVPHITLASLLEPLLRLGRAGEAAERHRVGYRLVRSNKEYLSSVGQHLAYLALSNGTRRGATLLERHLGWALETRDLEARFEFYRGAALLLERLRAAGRERITLRLPGDFPLHEPEGRYPLGALAAWFGNELDDLAARFDARNRSGRFAAWLAEGQALLAATPPTTET